MNFKTTREEALQDLENYINKDIINYSTQRNFDFGPVTEKMFHVYPLIFLID